MEVVRKKLDIQTVTVSEEDPFILEVLVKIAESFKTPPEIRDKLLFTSSGGKVGGFMRSLLPWGKYLLKYLAYDSRVILFNYYMAKAKKILHEFTNSNKYKELLAKRGLEQTEVNFTYASNLIIFQFQDRRPTIGGVNLSGIYLMMKTISLIKLWLNNLYTFSPADEDILTKYLIGYTSLGAAIFCKMDCWDGKFTYGKLERLVPYFGDV